MLFAPVSHELRHTTAGSGKYMALLAWGLRVADLTGIAASGVLAWWLRFGTLEIPLDYQRHIARGVLFALLVFSMSPLYRSWRGRGLAGELWTMLGAYTAVLMLSLLYATAFKFTSEISRLWGGTWFLAAVGLGTASRFAFRGAAAWTRKHGMDLTACWPSSSSCSSPR